MSTPSTVRTASSGSASAASARAHTTHACRRPSSPGRAGRAPRRHRFAGRREQPPPTFSSTTHAARYDPPIARCAISATARESFARLAHVVAERAHDDRQAELPDRLPRLVDGRALAERRLRDVRARRARGASRRRRCRARQPRRSRGVRARAPRPAVPPRGRPRPSRRRRSRRPSSSSSSTSSCPRRTISAAARATASSSSVRVGGREPSSRTVLRPGADRATGGGGGHLDLHQRGLQSRSASRIRTT